ncbi:hypothetical protein [Streptomyces sp. NPDC003660]
MLAIHHERIAGRHFEQFARHLEDSGIGLLYPAPKGSQGSSGGEIAFPPPCL